MSMMGFRRLRLESKQERILYSSPPGYDVSRKTSSLIRLICNSQLSVGSPQLAVPSLLPFRLLYTLYCISESCISELSANRYILLSNLDESRRPASSRASMVSFASVLCSRCSVATRHTTHTHNTTFRVISSL